MIKLAVNGAIAGFLVVAVSGIARRYARVADVILAVPLVVFAVDAVLYYSAQSSRPFRRWLVRCWSSFP